LRERCSHRRRTSQSRGRGRSLAGSIRLSLDQRHDTEHCAGRDRH
jgi:hypothetical protein